jgi:predicted dehydrogenase
LLHCFKSEPGDTTIKGGKTMKKIKLGIVGCGSVTRLYFPMLRDMAQKGELETAAVCDSSEKNLKVAREYLGTPHHYLDFDEMLANETIDAVVNLTPIQLHHAFNMKAIESGRHVYSEKPIASTVKEADEIIQAAKKKGVIVTCAPPMPLHPDHIRIKALVDRGALGKVCYARATGANPGPAWITEFTSDPTWFYKKGGGPIFDTGEYPIQLLTQILGPVKRVSAFAATSVPERVVVAGVAKGRRIRVEVPDNIQIMLDFGEGTFATVDVNYCKLSHKDSPRVELYGDRGIIYHYQRKENPIAVYRREDELGLRGWLTLEDSFWGACVPVMPMSQGPARPFSWAEGVLHLVRCIQEGKKPVLSAEFARHVLDVLVTALESAETGRAVEIKTGFDLPAA